MLQERARIARELHDSVAQTLYAITLGASRARSLLHRQEHREVKDIIDDVLALAVGLGTHLRVSIPAHVDPDG
jgi:signal transduction histidine kinase